MRKIIVGIMVTLLLIGMSTLAFNMHLVRAQSTTIYVDDDNTTGPWDGTSEHPFKNITSALNYATPWDTIYVRAGMYQENILVDKPVILVGESANNTVIQGSGTWHVIEFTWGTSDVVIKNFNITNSGPAPNSGIYVCHCQRIEITDNNIMYNGYGICLWDSDYNIVRENNITTDMEGVWLYCSRYNTIERNKINYTLKGIHLWGQIPFSEYDVFSGNDIENNGYGVYLDVGTGDNMFYHNNFTDNIQQVYINSIQNLWDDGYPSGGNYWSDYNDTDLYRGSGQNETGSDEIGDTPYVMDANNKDNYPLMNPWAPPDIAAIDVTPSRNIVGQGYSLGINATVTNQGNKIEGFNVTVYANITAIGKQTIILTSGNSTTITFTWNTAGFAKGNYTISAYAWPLRDETDISDNNCTNGWISVTIPGDVDGNFEVDIYDITAICVCYDSKLGPPRDPMYYPNCDLDGNGIIDIFDVTTACITYGQKYP